VDELPPCRWRECANGGFRCHSPRYVAPPNRVAADFCRSCPYVEGVAAPEPAVTRTTARFVVATLYTREIAEMGSLSAGVLRAYAARHGYEAVVSPEAVDPSRPAAWGKLLLVERHLAHNPSCEWLLWIDADAVITNAARRLEELIDDADFLVSDDPSSSPINSGVFLARNCPAVLDLLRRAYAKVQYLFHPWWEQLALAEALRESGPALRSRVVPRRLFNAFPGEHRAGDFVIHFAGCPREVKLAGVRQAVAALTHPTLQPDTGSVSP